jgi:branched-chain amino acid transport system substrate-binding protein
MNLCRRNWLARASAAAVAIGLAGGWISAVQARQPIKVGIGIAQTGTLGGGGKAALLALQMWRDDVNAKAGCSDARSS